MMCDGHTASIYNAKTITNSTFPFTTRVGDGPGGIVYLFDHKFLSEMRRQFSGTIEYSHFNPNEQALYDSFVNWVDGEVYDTRLTAAVEALDKWLVDEVDNIPQASILTGDNKICQLNKTTREIAYGI